MQIFSLGPVPALAVAIATALVAGCVSTASDGRYQTNPRGGWDNFRDRFAESRNSDRLASPADFLEYGQARRLELRNRDFTHFHIRP